jgi:hypothetical protein
MITMLGQGLLYRVHTCKEEMLTKAEQKRAALLACSIVAFLIISILLWIK